MAKDKTNSKGSHGWTEMSSGLIHNLKQEVGYMPLMPSPDAQATPKQSSSPKANLKQLGSLFDAKGGKD